MQKSWDGLMNNVQNWLVNLAGAEFVWIVELFLIVLVVLSLGYILNRVIDRLEKRASQTKTVWDDA
jgi:MscS family membrane protein